MEYDLLVVGNDRDGVARAITEAQNGLRVALISTSETVASLEVVRRAANNIAEYRDVTMSAWRAEVARLSECQRSADRAELECLGIEVMTGTVRFVASNCVEVISEGQRQYVTAEEIVIATGTKPRVPESLRGDDRFVLSIETMLNLNDVPRTVVVVGAGETGLSAAMMLATLGVEVLVVDENVSLPEIYGPFGSSTDVAQTVNIAFRLGDEAIGIEGRPDIQSGVRLASGRVLTADAVLICVGREGMTAGLGLEFVGVGLDERGRIWCNRNGTTWTSGITAVGDVIGFPRGTGRIPEELDRTVSAIVRNAYARPSFLKSSIA